MREGVYLCSGTRAYLKEKYPCGYNINCIINSKLCTKEKKNELLFQLKEIDSTAEIKVSSKFFLSFNLLGTGDIIKQVFSHLDNVKTSYGIDNYTLTTTTLEDVFIKSNNSNNSLYNNKPIIEIPNEIIINDNSINIENHNNFSNRINVSFFNQLKAHLNRYFRTLWLTKTNYIIEVFSAIFLLLFYIFGFSQLLQESINTDPYIFDNLLKDSPILYKIDPDLKELLFQSTYYNNIKKSINLIEYPYDISIHCTPDELIDNYNISSPYQNARDIFFIRKSETNSNKIDVINLYMHGGREFYIATMNLIISSILENKFNVYVNLYKEVNSMKIENKKQNNILLIGGISVGLMCWSFLSFSAYILNESLKEKVTNVKQMLLLSGANLFSYWVGLFIVDSIKFTIFILMIYPLFLFIEPRYTYFFILFVPFSFTMIIVSYCFSFRYINVREGKRLFVLSVFAITLVLCLIMAIDKFMDDNFNLKNIICDRYIPNFLYPYCFNQNLCIFICSSY